MKTEIDSALYRLGIMDHDGIPICAAVRWDSKQIVATICIESLLDPNQYDRETPFDPEDCFGMSLESMALDALTDEEWERMIEIMFSWRKS